MFPANNVWNTPITGLPVDSHSAAWLRSMDSSSTFLHPDFGPSGDLAALYGIPFSVVSNNVPFVHVDLRLRESESDCGPYPFGPTTPIEGGQNCARATVSVRSLSIDRHASLYELYDATYHAGGSTAAGIRGDLESALERVAARDMDVRRCRGPADSSGAARLRRDQVRSRRPCDPHDGGGYRIRRSSGRHVRPRGGGRATTRRCRRWVLPGSG